MTRRMRIGVLGYFGIGNIGNEGTLEAFLDYLRAQHPDAEILCLAAEPDQVTRDHGVEAVRLMSYRPGPGSGAVLTVRKALSRLVDAPRIFRLVGRTDAVAVPGTGVLETSLLTQPWSLPYWLFLTAVACRLRRRPFALVSVGAEPTGDPTTRFFHRWTVRLADYVSYRDEASRATVAAMGAAREDARLYPDLAFGLPTPAVERERPDLVVLGVMRYEVADHGRSRGPEAVRAYVVDTTRLIADLVAAGRTVRMVVGDVADLTLAEEIEQRVVREHPEVHGRVTTSVAATLTELMGEMAGAGVVVASRFHNVICALKLAVPTVSLGYAGKNARVLEEFGLGELSQRMDSLDVDLVVAQVARAGAIADEVRPAMHATAQRFGAELADQEKRLSSEVFGAAAR
ncbi:polysaccharide pyruvyl transferase WcaK-like protein [Mumia flava]|uniref:Polysaccharide pyruvyl transferase WcaK-like protein n=1 Tax=Mumia flava TaxID=1348852 RepID=A0A2M9BFY6_9ACTN|nr:polysaccharide pyruvyl transferase family protein [Mumia flava]PJJ56860.1 polysaccharide pyruvyl transferase WcaK-like protein [Mumia flava]